MENIEASIPEAQNSNLEATYVTIVKDIVAKKIPEHKASFDITLNEINRQITGEGLFQWSSERSGVKFLAGHLQVTPELIERIAHGRRSGDEAPRSDPEDENPRAEHYVYFIEPSFGLGEDGSALSALDMGIARFINEMPKVARAIRAGEKPPTVDIFMVGGPTALGGEVTEDFVQRVKENGFSEYGPLYSEFVVQKLADFDLHKTRIVLQGASKGAVTSDLTYKNLPVEVQERTQLLYDNPGGTQGQTLPSEIGRSVNLGVGMATELGVRAFAGSVKNGAFAGQKEFYESIKKKLGILEDSDEQKKLKADLFMKGEIKALAKGTPLDKDQRSFTRISTPDPVNINFSNIARVISGGVVERVTDLKDKLSGRKLAPRRALTATQKSRNITFATGNTVHNFPWVRNIDSGGWARKMEYVENSKLT